MNDPHVEALQYSLVTDVGDDFAKAQDCAVSNEQFEGTLSQGILTLRPKQHFSTEVEARTIADRFARAWEISAGLGQTRPILRFRFSGAQLVDRAPTPGRVEIAASDTVSLSERWSVTTAYLSYPLPPTSEFRLIPEVEALWDRFGGYRAGRELLLNMAYFSLTLIANFGGGSKRQAAAAYKIDAKILDKIGELTSERGDHLIARKLTKRTGPLTLAEASWLEAAILAIMRHLAGPRQNQLRMSDLPQL